MSDPRFTKPWHGIPRDTIAWRPTVDPDTCIGCGNCVTSCGRLVYRFDFDASKAVVAEPLQCMVGCTTCATTCPAHAIHFPDPDILKPLVNARSFREGLRQELAARQGDLEWHDVAPHCDRRVRMRVAHLEDDGPVRVLTLALESGEDTLCQIMPGQHLQILPPGEALGRRLYPSYPSPREDGTIVVRFDVEAAGRLAHWVRHDAGPGDEVTVTGPRGEMTLENVMRPLLMVSAGAGFAVSRELVAQSLRSEPRDVIAVHATTRAGVPDPGVLATWAGRPGLELHLVWPANTTAVPDQTTTGFTTHRANLTSAIEGLGGRLQDRDCYVAARRPVARQITQCLQGQGVAADHIHVDYLAT
ncbi:MAG: 4Fe-4S binding protein [Nitriliruptoraceae bacterium]